MQEEEIMHGILCDKDCKGYYDLTQLKVMVCDICQLSSYWATLTLTLQTYFDINLSHDKEFIKFTIIFKALSHDYFIENVPKFMNHRETYSNIKLIKAAIIISQKKLLSLKKIKEGIHAWTQICRQENCSNLKIDYDLLNKALQLINLTMSEILMKKWFVEMREYLECENKNRKAFDKLVLQIYKRQKQERLAEGLQKSPSETMKFLLKTQIENQDNVTGGMQALLGSGFNSTGGGQHSQQKLHSSSKQAGKSSIHSRGQKDSIGNNPNQIGIDQVGDPNSQAYKKLTDKMIDEQELASLGSEDRIFPHEFLYLMANAKNRRKLMNKLPRPNFNIIREELIMYEELNHINGQNLGEIYRYDLEECEQDLNPRKRLKAQLNGPEYANKNVQIEGLRKPTVFLDIEVKKQLSKKDAMLGNQAGNKNRFNKSMTPGPNVGVISGNATGGGLSMAAYATGGLTTTHANVAHANTLGSNNQISHGRKDQMVLKSALKSNTNPQAVPRKQSACFGSKKYSEFANNLIGHKNSIQDVTLTPDQSKTIKKKMMDKNFYADSLKKTLSAANEDLFRSRVGMSCTDQFVQTMDKNQCQDKTRLQTKYDATFRTYLQENPVRPRSAVNFNKIQTGFNMRQKMPLFKPPQELTQIAKQMSKIKSNQKKIINEAYNTFKNEAGSIFTREAIGQNATIAKYLKHKIKSKARPTKNDPAGNYKSQSIYNLQENQSKKNIHGTGNDLNQITRSASTIAKNHAQASHASAKQPVNAYATPGAVVKQQPRISIVGTTDSKAQGVNSYASLAPAGTRDPILTKKAEEFATDCDTIFKHDERKRKPEYHDTMKRVMALSLAQHKEKCDKAEEDLRREELKTKIDSPKIVQDDDFEREDIIQDQLSPQKSQGQLIQNSVCSTKLDSATHAKGGGNGGLDRPYELTPSQTQGRQTGVTSQATLQRPQTINMNNSTPNSSSKRPQTADLRVTSAMLNTVHKKFGYAPSEVLKDTKIDTKSFVADGTLKEEHVKLFSRVDGLVEADKIALELSGKTQYNCDDIKDKILRDRELNLLKELKPVEAGVFKKIPPRVQNPLFD